MKKAFLNNKRYEKSNSKNKKIKFIFQNGDNFSMNNESFLALHPYMKKDNNMFSESNINLPDNINKEDLSLYLIMIKHLSKKINNENYLDYNNIMKSKKVINLLKISDYFQNEEFNIKLINKLLLSYNCDNIILDLLNYSYKKLSVFSNKSKEANNVYFDLFYQSLENITKNEKIVLSDLGIIKNLDKKLIYEIIEKVFNNLIYGNTFLMEGNETADDIFEEYYFPTYYENNDKNKFHFLNYKEFNELIKILMEVEEKNNFFELLTSEYSFLLSKESINELKNLPYPSLQVDIHFSEYSYYSQEFPLDIILNQKRVILIISYNKEEQSFNINIKLSKEPEKKCCNSILEIDNISEKKKY
jgi:hypothetical protein